MDRGDHTTPARTSPAAPVVNPAVVNPAVVNPAVVFPAPGPASSLPPSSFSSAGAPAAVPGAAPATAPPAAPYAAPAAVPYAAPAAVPVAAPFGGRATVSGVAPMTRPAALAAPAHGAAAAHVAAPTALPTAVSPSPSVGSVAFHPAARPPAPAPVPRRPERRRRNRFARRPDLVRIACWQLAVVAVARALGEPWPTLLATTLAALAVLALTAIRVRGRLLGEIAVRACCFPLRARRRDLPAESRSEALIALLLPGSTVRTVQTGPGPVLVISHPGGLTAVVRPRADHPVAPLPTPAALLPAAKEQRHSFGVQAVLHVGVRRDAPPRVWFAVHVDRTVEAPDDDELTVALRNGLRRVRRVLARAGVPADGLPEEAALAAVAALGHVTGGRHEIRADWRYWRTGPVSQACYRLDGWDRVHEGIRWRLAHDLLTRTAGVAATVTFGARTGAATGAVLRLAATTEAAVERAAAVVGDLCGHFDVHLVRLDGAHVSGVAASLPIGGFLP